MVMYYSSHESSIRAVFRWKNTLTKVVLSSIEFWIYMFIAVLVSMLLTHTSQKLPKGVVGTDVFKIVGAQLSLTIFAAIFYNSQCYARFMNQYETCMEMEAKLRAFVSEMLVDFSFDGKLRPLIVIASKFMVASIFSFYGLMQADGGKREDAWRLMQDKGLLSKSDAEFLAKFPGHIVMLLHHWSLNYVREAIAHPSTQQRYSPPERAAMMNRLQGSIISMSKAHRKILNTANRPIPFQYFHLLNMLIFTSIITMGFGCFIIAEKAGENYGIALLPFGVILFALLALRNLSGMLADPFGDDHSDLPTDDFMRHAYDQCAAMLTAELGYDPLARGVASTVAFSELEILVPFSEHRQIILNHGLTEREPQHQREWEKPENMESAKDVAQWIGGAQWICGSKNQFSPYSLSGNESEPLINKKE